MEMKTETAGGRHLLEPVLPPKYPLVSTSLITTFSIVKVIDQKTKTKNCQPFDSNLFYNYLSFTLRSKS